MSRNAFDSLVREMNEAEDYKANVRMERQAAAAGNCSYCGEELELRYMTEQDGDWYCADCYTPKEEDDEPQLCSACNGSGEGMYDGTRCHYCHGRGTE